MLQVSDQVLCTHLAVMYSFGGRKLLSRPFSKTSSVHEIACVKHSESTMVVASRLCKNVQPRYWCHLFKATCAENTLIESFHPNIGSCANWRDLKVKTDMNLLEAIPNML